MTMLPRSSSPLIESLRNVARQVVTPLIDPRRRIALVDFPNHSNVGDSAIWSGELALLRELGVERLAYVCDGSTYNRKAMLKAIGPEGLVLLHGGGNLGDLWPWHQKLREVTIRDFPDHDIVQLPQTIHFENPAALARARDVFVGHARFTLLARATTSLEVVERDFPGVAARLAPDSAFFITVPELGVVPDVDIMWLARTDRETVGRPTVSAGDVVRVDWLDENNSPIQLANAALRFPTHYAPRSLRAVLSKFWTPTFCEALAWERVVRGMKLLRRGHVVITDRLHGHILCEMLGIPHVMLATKYLKIRGFWGTWTATSTLAHWADSEDAAVQKARELVREVKAGRRG